MQALTVNEIEQVNGGGMINDSFDDVIGQITRGAAAGGVIGGAIGYGFGLTIAVGAASTAPLAFAALGAGMGICAGYTYAIAMVYDETQNELVNLT
ncbi:hypothetical protein [Shewanella surugensis]|uniref:Bacteriocin n=1 Tax=Shewanella surugensis TaxID=212020 RepID=A0ABT0L5H5_9GAMM|nr:hypothetical protein [Shewanella surugensis]MCL1122939.1 hypothetical protein [Shewanella surugensis]